MTTEKQIAANRDNAKEKYADLGRSTANEKHDETRSVMASPPKRWSNRSKTEGSTRLRERKSMRIFDPATNLERQLVGRLVSLIWRLRRATAIEAGLLALQTDLSRNHSHGTNLDVFYRLLGSDKQQCEFEFHWPERNETPLCQKASLSSEANAAKLHIARSFLRVAVLDGAVF